MKLSKVIPDLFADADDLIGALAATELPAPQEETVRKWVARDTIPGTWILPVLRAIEVRHGNVPTIAFFL